ncbi:MAG: ATP-binding protein, partial [Myxococcota bacterium]
EDDGPGIPEAMRSRLFDSFATHGKKGGTGLGLAIVRQVVEDHFGSIEVESAPGCTVFKVRLPVLSDYSSSSGAISAASA